MWSLLNFLLFLCFLPRIPKIPKTWMFPNVEKFFIFLSQSWIASFTSIEIYFLCNHRRENISCPSLMLCTEEVVLFFFIFLLKMHHSLKKGSKLSKCMTVINMHPPANLSVLGTMQGKKEKRIHAKNPNSQHNVAMLALVDPFPSCWPREKLPLQCLKLACENLLPNQQLWFPMKCLQVADMNLYLFQY